MWVVAFYGALASAFHVWRLGAPLGTHELNLGHYFGASVNIWDHYGCLAMRGMPSWTRFPDSLASALPYANHPPGVFWSMYAFGVEEWALRMPGMLAGIVAASLFYIIVRRRMPTALALPAGAVLLLSPGVSAIGLGSYEVVVMAAGLGLFAVADPARPCSRLQARDRWILAAVSFIGPWCDWQFGFFAFALAILCISRGWRGWFAALWVPGLAALASVILVVAWRAWALEGVSVIASEDAAFGRLFGSSLGGRPTLHAWLSAAGPLIVKNVGWVVAVMAACGVPLLLWRERNGALALAFAGLGPAVTFARHALDHALFYTPMVPLMVACAFGLLACLLKWRQKYRAAVIAGAWLLAIVSCAISQDVIDDGSSPFPRDVARQMVLRAGRVTEHTAVISNYKNVYLYYVDDPRVLPLPVEHPEIVEMVRKMPDAVDGVWFLWWEPDPASRLGEYLVAFESSVADFSGAAMKRNAPRWIWLPALR